jgi:hypothetical protein
MAKKTASSKGNSVQGYFRVIFRENPKLLKERSNEALYARWLQDHPGATEVPLKVKQGLSNLKSVLRGKMKLRKRRKQAEAAAANGAVSAVRPVARARKIGGLDRLEAQIDDALSAARHLDAEGLEEVIRLLRSARNRVIIQIGEV